MVWKGCFLKNLKELVSESFRLGEHVKIASGAAPGEGPEAPLPIAELLRKRSLCVL